MQLLKNAILLLALLLAQSMVAESGWQTLGDVVSLKQTGSRVELTAQRGRVRIEALAAAVIRITYTVGDRFPEVNSLTVLPNAFPQAPPLNVKEGPGSIELSTGTLRLEITRRSLRIAFFDASGKLISEDRPGYPASFNGTSFQVWKSMPDDEHYFGLGDKTGPLDHRDLAFTIWNTDAFGWQESTDPLYKSFPFFLAVRSGVSYGLYLDNTYRSNFDFGKEFRDAYSFGAEGGALDYYFFYGPDPKQVIGQFTQLVGRTPLPPLFALGYQQCRYSYYPEARVRELAAEFRKRKIPADVIYLDIDYQQDNRAFTVNRERFPNFEGMVKDLGTQGFKVVAITDLHLAKLPGYPPYDEGAKAGYFVRNPDASVYTGAVWPGPSVFPDFTRDEVRRWWGTLYTGFVNAGIRGFWNDMNEPAVFSDPARTLPLDTVHNVEGRISDHREIHNVFGMENARATYEGWLRLRPNLRPFVLTRAAFAGTQQYAATWTGDNTATWNHMRISIPQLINLGLSGYSLVGDDIGGFSGNPTPELLTRWMELGAFNPMYRNHSAKETRFREPWLDGPEHERIRQRYIETRYRLLPYVYSTMEEASRTGVPLMRPMFLEFPDDPSLATNGNEFMFGPSLLVAPKVMDLVGAYSVVLPKGEWFDYWTGTRLAGGQTIQVDPPLDTLPVYVRAGAILPQQPVVQNVEELPQGPLELRVYPGPACSGDLYMDDGNTFAYQRGDTLRLHFACNATAHSVAVDISAPSGPYRPWFHDLQLTIYGLAGRGEDVVLDGKPVSEWKQDGSSLTIRGIRWDATARHVRVNLAAPK